MLAPGSTQLHKSRPHRACFHRMNERVLVMDVMSMVFGDLPAECSSH